MAQIDPNNVAKQFTDFYYKVFDGDRAQLGALYRHDSMLTFEQDQILGANDIVGKLTRLPFQMVRHQVTTIDAQPSKLPGAILVSVTGLLLVDEESNPLNFSQVFQLVNEGGSYYISNDIFRLNLG